VRSLVRQVRTIARRITWVRPPVRCAPVRVVAVAAHGEITLRKAVREEAYSLPASCDPAVRCFYEPLSRVLIPEEVRCTIPGGRVVGPGIVVSPDGHTIARDVSVVFGGTADDHPLMHVERIPRPRRLRGRTLNVASAGGESYYHWLLDELPRFLEAAGDRHDAVIGHRGHLMQAAEMIGFRGRMIEVHGRRHYQCDQLAVASVFGTTGHPTAEAVGMLQDFATRHGLRQLGGGRRRKIFISRAATRVRRLVHENDIWNRLQARGFERLFLETMSWEEQIAAFTAAETVVAPHGAGLANLVFCHPGTRVIELFDRRYLHWCYWQLAAVSGLEYHAVVSAGEAPPTHDFAHLGTNIDVPWDRLPADAI